MPMDYSKYPKDWKKISYNLRLGRAENKCEWCHVPNYAFRFNETNVVLTGDDVDLLDDHDDLEEATLIILTVAHLGIDKPDGSPGDKADTMDCRDENLAVLCQRCHLNFDRPDNINRRRINRRKSLVRAGQLEMF